MNRDASMVFSSLWLLLHTIAFLLFCFFTYSDIQESSPIWLLLFDIFIVLLNAAGIIINYKKYKRLDCDE